MASQTGLIRIVSVLAQHGLFNDNCILREQFVLDKSHVFVTVCSLCTNIFHKECCSDSMDHLMKSGTKVIVHFCQISSSLLYIFWKEKPYEHYSLASNGGSTWNKQSWLDYGFLKRQEYLKLKKEKKMELPPWLPPLYASISHHSSCSLHQCLSSHSGSLCFLEEEDVCLI